MRENAGFIARGLTWTMVIAVLAVVARVDPGAPRGARPTVPQRDRGRRHRLLHLVLPGHAADRADVPDLPGPAADRPGARAVLGRSPHARRAHGRRPRPRPQLRRVHDRDLPGRHPVGRPRAGRGRRGARHDVPAEDAPGRAAAGRAGDHPADRQRVHRDDEGHRPRQLPRHDGRPDGDLPPRAARRAGPTSATSRR